jgi:nucleoside-diphosphate-sugar epimerase
VDFSDRTVLITGAAGFIGFYLAKEILEKNVSAEVIGFDSMNDYYDVSLKEERLKILKETAEREDTGTFHFVKGNLAEKEKVDAVFRIYKPEFVVNLAAQAGVRYSITNPEAYIESNIVGFFHILEACRHSYEQYPGGVRHLVYASSSSVYGSNRKIPYAVEDKTDCPVSLYAATKKSDELLAYSYGKLYQIPMTGLRFFTVYGPLGRPDMAYFGFTNKLVKGEKIQIFNYGDMYRDFTYIDDIIKGVVNVMGKIPEENEDNVKYKIYNIGNSSPESLLDFVETLETCLLEEGIIEKPGEKELLPMQPGDVYRTFADVSELEKDFGFKPQTSLREGLSRYAKWYRQYYGKQG